MPDLTNPGQIQPPLNLPGTTTVLTTQAPGLTAAPITYVQPAFQRLLIDFMVAGSARVTWTLARHLNDPNANTWTYQLFTADVDSLPNFNPDGTLRKGDNWQPCGQPQVNVTSLTDQGRRAYGKTLTTSYRVQLTTPRGIYLSGPATPFGKLNKHDWIYVQEIARKEMLLHKKFTSTPGYLLRRKREGPPCPNCLDAITSEVGLSRCLTCYGTGYDGGYYAAVPLTFGQIQLTQTREQRTTQVGMQKQEVTQGRFLAVPGLHSFDVFVEEGSDKRYIIHTVGVAAQLRSVPVILNVELRAAEFSDVIYQFPVSPNTTFTPETPMPTPIQKTLVTSTNTLPINKPSLSLLGGWTNAGITGNYYSNGSLTGTPAFTRKETRLSFSFQPNQRPGGSSSPGFADVPGTNWSAQFVGQLLPQYSDDYMFSVAATGTATAKFEIKPATSSTWSSIVPFGTGNTNPGQGGSSAYRLHENTLYDVRVSYYSGAGANSLQVLWAGNFAPEEIIDCLYHSGINNPDLRALYADVIRGGGRNTWAAPPGHTTIPTIDSNGWPQADGQYVMSESLNQGLPIDPLMLGTLTLQCNGTANLSLFGNTNNDLVSSYNPATNTTSGTFTTKTAAAGQGSNAADLYFTNTSRTGQTGGPGGITNLKIMKPVAPNASTSYGFSTLLDSTAKAAFTAAYTALRFQRIANNERSWSDRTPPTFFNQNSGKQTASFYQFQYVLDPTSNGISWEYAVLIANETGRDLQVSIPPLANDDYVTKLCQLLLYGSDGVNPYTQYNANPIYPPLNSNLFVVFEMGNELWNFGSPFFQDFENIRHQLSADIAAQTPIGKWVTYDGASSPSPYRWVISRLVQWSELARAVSAAAINTTFRFSYYWQYANENSTASDALTFAERFFTGTDPASTYTGTKRPLCDFLYYGGGASYYGAENNDGTTDLLSDPYFSTPTVSAGLNQNPSGATNTYTGTAGIAGWTSGNSLSIPTPENNRVQLGYITNNGAISFTFTAPLNQVSNYYAFDFRALNQVGSSLRVQAYLDYGTSSQTEISHKTYSQAPPYVPRSNNGSDWSANLVFWTSSRYYATNCFQMTPGQTRTVTLVGSGTGTIYFSEARITSADSIFENGIPAGGEAAGQPINSSILNTLFVEGQWASMYGLVPACYESGWSLGGDDGGSPLQLNVKFFDNRTSIAQQTFIQYCQEAGNAWNLFGYIQWPSWDDITATQGILNATSYPLVAGILQAQNSLPNVVTNGATTPCVLTPRNAVLSDNIGVTDGWYGWTLAITQTTTYTITTTASSPCMTLVDGRKFTGTTIVLYPGLHSVRVVSTAGALSLSSVSVTQIGILNGFPVITSAIPDANAATLALTWTSVAGATSYLIKWGLSSTSLTNPVTVDGNTNSVLLTSLPLNTSLYFTVTGQNASGNGFPSLVGTSYLLPDNVLGPLGSWDITQSTNGQSSIPPISVAAGITLTPLALGGSFQTVTSSTPGLIGLWGGNTTDLGTDPNWFQFTVTGVTKTIQLKQLSFTYYVQNASTPAPTVQVEVNGTVVYSGTGTTFPYGLYGHTVDLSSVAAGTTFAFKIQAAPVGPYCSQAIGRVQTGFPLLLEGELS